MTSEIIHIDERYSIRIIDRGKQVDLLRYGEEWCNNHPQAKVFIAVASELEKLRDQL